MLTTSNTLLSPDTSINPKHDIKFLIGSTRDSNVISLYKPVIKSLYSIGEYALEMERHTNAHFGLNYDGGIFFGTYSS